MPFSFCEDKTINYLIHFTNKENIFEDSLWSSDKTSNDLLRYNVGPAWGSNPTSGLQGKHLSTELTGLALSQESVEGTSAVIKDALENVL